MGLGVKLYANLKAAVSSADKASTYKFLKQGRLPFLLVKVRSKQPVALVDGGYRRKRGA